MSRAEGPPRAPAGLEGPGRALWRTLMAGFSTEGAELAVVRSACELEDRAAACAVVLRKEGLTTTDRYGSTRPHPLLAEERNARVAVARMLKQLGVAPVPVEGARSRPGPNQRARTRAARLRAVADEA